MATGPKELTSTFLEELDRFEKMIDNELIRNQHFFTPSVGTVSINVPVGINSRHFKVLQQRYLDAGWDSVEWHSDQRDGDYICFKAKI